MAKKKKFDMFEHAMDTTMISAGSLMGTGLVGRLPSSPIKGKVLDGMSTMSILPTMHATGGIMGGLGELERMSRKARKRR